MISRFLLLAQHAYGDSKEPFYQDGAKEVYFFDAKKKGRADVQFYTIENEKELIFAIRGSESLSDFKDDSFFWTEQFQDVSANGVRVHAGFLKQYQAMRFNMTSSVYRMIWKHNNKKVIFVGHSLGGALATLCGAAIKEEFPELYVAVYSFGSPRVGNKTFAEVFEKVDECVRCVNGSDIVASLPYWGYYHVKGEHCIGNKSYLNISDHSLEKYKINC